MTVLSLLNRPKPYPDETLTSWLWRLAKLNYADSPAWFLPYLRNTWPAVTTMGLGSVNGLRDVLALEAIAALTRYSVTDVHQHTLHRFANMLRLPSQIAQERSDRSGIVLTFLPGRVSNDFYSPRFSWCPRCLAEAHYVRLHWHFLLVACCEIHCCWLLKDCPGCQIPITEVDAINGQCGKCAFKLEQAATVPLAATDPLWQLQSTVMSWLYGQSELLPLGLPDVPVNTLLYVLSGLRSAAQLAGNGWAFHHIPSQIPIPDLDIHPKRYLNVFERGCLYATAFRALQDWPNGFFAFLDAYQVRPSKKKKETGLRREFGVLHITWLDLRWKHSSFEFIQEAYNDYLVAHMPAYQVIETNRIVNYPLLLRRLEYLDICRSAHYLGLWTGIIHRLVREGHLTAYRFEQSDGMWLSRGELDQLQQRWEQHITPPEAARLLGVTPAIARELLREHLLQSVPASEALKLQRTYLYRDSVQTLIQKLKLHTTMRPDADQTGVSLVEVSMRNGSIGLGFPQLLGLICAGILAAYHPDVTLFPLTALWFPMEVVANLSDTVKEENEWMNLQETEKCLGVRRSILHHFIELGLLHPTVAYGPKKLFSRKIVLALRGRYLSSRQAAAMLNISMPYISSLIRHGLLIPVSGPRVNGNSYYIFDRNQLIAWGKRYILYGEMKKLAPNVCVLLRLLKARTIEPLIRTPRVYLRKEVMTVLESMQIGLDSS